MTTPPSTGGATPQQHAAPIGPVSRPQPRSAPSVGTTVRIAVSIALLALLAWKIDLWAAGAVLAQARPVGLLLLLGVFIFERLFAAYRWRLLLQGRCPTATLPALIRITMVSNFVGAFLPGVVGVEALRVLGLTRQGCNLAQAFTSVFLDRVLGVVSLLLMVLVGLSMTARMLPTAIAWTAGASLVVLIAMCLLLLSRPVRVWADRVMPPVIARYLRHPLTRLYECIDAYRRDRVLLLGGLVLAVLMQCVRVVGTIAAAWALRLDIDVLDYFIFVPAIMFVTMIPISIGGLGVREAAFSQLFGLAGMAPEAAVVLSLLIFIVDLIATLPGAWFYARGNQTGSANAA